MFNVSNNQIANPAAPKANTGNDRFNSITTGNAGGGGSHNHGHNLSGSMSGAPGVGNLAVSSGSATINCKYVDVICAAKD